MVIVYLFFAYTSQAQTGWHRFGKVRVLDSLRIKVTTKTDTTANKPMAMDASGNVYRFPYWPGGSSGPGGGTVTDFIFTDGSGFDGTVVNSTSTPSLSLTTTLTTASVPFIGASGALSQDNAAFNFIDGNNALYVDTGRFLRVQSPVFLGGTATNSSIIYQSTTANGTGVAHSFRGGNNGATTIADFNNDGTITSTAYGNTLYRQRWGDFVIQPFALNNGFLANNGYHNGSSWTRPVTGYMSGFQFFNGQTIFNAANTGTGNFTPSNVFKVDYNGNVALGGTAISTTLGTFTGATMLVTPTEVLIGSVTDQGTFSFQNTGNIYQNGLVQLRGIPGGTQSMTMLVHGTDSNLYQIQFPYQLFYSDNSSTTVANTTVETTILGAGAGTAQYSNITAGSVLSLKGSGVISTDATPGTPELAFNIGNYTLGMNLPGLSGGLINVYYDYVFELIPVTTGINQDVMVNCKVNVYESITVTKSFTFVQLASGSFTTTGSPSANVTVQWDAADVDNSVTAIKNIVEIFRK